MAKIVRIIKAILWFLDGLYMAVTPMLIILVVVSVIVLLERGGGHFRFVYDLERDGLVAEGTIVSDEPSETLGWQVQFYDYAQEDERYGYLSPYYYTPEVVALLKPGAEVQIRYLPQSYKSNVILNEHFNQVRGYWGYAYDAGIMFLVAWVGLILHPEFLYLGYDVPFSELMQQRFQRMAGEG